MNITNHTTPQSRAKRWCFTLNNYDDESQQRVRELATSSEYLVFGREVGDSGTPHLQGFIIFKNQLRFNRVQELLPGCHLSVARTVSQAAEYCRKDGDFEEFGTIPVDTSGKRSDIDSFKEAVENGEVKNFHDALLNHSAVYAKYPKFVHSYLEAKYTKKKEIVRHELREWQSILYSDLERQVDERKIIFIVDEKGNSGKSWFCDYVRELKPNVQILTPGKKADMAYEFYTATEILFMDAPRSKQSEFIQYDFLEDVKNGRIFSTKYESQMKYFKPPHVVVMMNESPDMTKLSEDRYDIRRV
jgi:Putative viral replication protein